MKIKDERIPLIDGKIYKITNIITGESYIGQTVNSIEERFRHHKQGTRQAKCKMTKLQQAMEEYGKRNFTIELIEDNVEDIETLALYEKFYIQKYKTYNEYNSTVGGESRLRGVRVDNSINLSYSERTVAFKNDFNLCSFSGCTQKSLDLLFGLITEISPRDGLEYSVPLDEAFERAGFINFPATENKLKEWVEKTNKNLSTVVHPNYLFDKDLKAVGYIESLFFDKLEFNRNTNEISFRVNKKFLYMFDKGKGKNYTKFKINDFIGLKNKYSKLLFRLLSQWTKYGEATFSLNELKRLMDCPESYDTRRFNEKILIPAMESVSELIPDLVVNRQKRGKEISHYKFSFTPQ